MVNSEILRQFAQLSIPPETGTVSYEQWIQQRNFFQFLLDRRM